MRVRKHIDMMGTRMMEEGILNFTPFIFLLVSQCQLSDYCCYFFALMIWHSSSTGPDTINERCIV